MTHQSAAVRPELRRELGKWDLTAIGVNQVIGAAIFATPGTLAAQVGGWSWIAVIAVGVLAMFVALNFAEASSRFDRTGGAYLYTRAAFGRFPGFQVGWMLFVTRATSWASVINALADALGYYWPELRAGALRMALITAVIVAITIINVRGVKQSAYVVNALTLAKLTPLVLFIALGLPHVSGQGLQPDTSVTLAQWSATALLLIFAYGGYEVIPVPAGEARDPKRAVPFAMIATLVIVAVVMTLVQIVALGTLPTLAQSKTPLADASFVFIGAWGALLMTAGAAISMTGNNVGQALSGSQESVRAGRAGGFAGSLCARAREVPHAGHRDRLHLDVRARHGVAFRFPDARGRERPGPACRLRGYVRVRPRAAAPGPAPFTIPLGPTIPVLAIVISTALLYGASALQFKVGAAFLVAGAVLYAVARMRSK